MTYKCNFLVEMYTWKIQYFEYTYVKIFETSSMNITIIPLNK